MNAHTDGKWYTTCGYVAAEETYRHNRGVICTMANDRSSMQHCAGQGTEEDSANARLIAAAPELLATVNELAAALANWHHVLDNGQANGYKLSTVETVIHYNTPELLDKARAAVALATGEETP